MNLLRFTLAGCLSLAVATTCWSAQAAPPPLPFGEPVAAGYAPERLERLHRSLEQLVDAQAYSGYIVLLARQGRIVDWRAYGWQDISAQVPLQRDSIVRLYSMSKIVTSTAILMLLEEGKLRLGDRIERFLPALANRVVYAGGTVDQPQLVPATRPITIRDLLTHTAGFFYDETWSAEEPLITLQQRARLWEAQDLNDFVQRVAQVPLHDQPGTRYRYGINTDLLGAIVEKASGQTLDQFFQERIFAPLGMRDSGFVVPPEKQARLAQVHQRNAQGRVEPVTDMGAALARTPPGLWSGGGGLYSTAGDYARFAQMLLNGGELDGRRLLSRKTIELMTQNHIAHLAVPHPFNIPSQGFGLGVRVVTDLGRSTVLGSPGTFGWDGMATTLVQIDPREQTVALLICQHLPFNQDDIMATFTNGVYQALAD